jgi:hypothetical protein
MINSIAPSKPAALLTALERLLPSVQKPARYLGHEVNAVHKDPSKVKVHVGLAFPDVYEVGMSHLGEDPLFDHKCSLNFMQSACLLHGPIWKR